MNCKSFRREFEETEALSPEAHAHTQECSACRTFQSEQLSLNRLVRSLGTVNAPPDFDFRLRARIKAAESSKQAPGRLRFAPGLKAISVAASFALLFAAAIVFKQTQSGQTGAPVVAQSRAFSSGNEESSPKTFDASLKEREADLVADASESTQALITENEADAQQAGVMTQSRGRAERVAQAKQARNATPAKTNQSPVISNDITFGGNPPIVTPLQSSPTKDAGDTEAAALLRVSSQPLRVLLHDREGATRSVALERVVFGSQDFLERTAQKRPVASDVEGIW